jgi:sensor histidine kinase YesM
MPILRPYPYKRLLRDTPFALVFNLGFALIITAVVGRIDAFWPNFVVSMCIGSFAFLLIDGLRLLIWDDEDSGRGRRWRGMIPIVLVSIPIAQYLGARLAGWILDRKIPTIISLENAEQSHSMLVVTVFGTVGASLFFASRERIAKAQAELARERARAEATERQALQAQLQLLQAQIEPHMLFNTLANLRGLIGLDPARAEEMLDQLIHFLRATLVSARAAATNLGEEFALMDAYLGLMTVRMGARLQYTLDLPDALRGQQLPPMLLQPLVENAIVHGLEPKIDGGSLHIAARAEDDMLIVTVTDNGRGLDAPPVKAGTNVGVTNTRERLQALYGERASLAIEAALPQGVTSTLRLPMNKP